ncbi:phthiocerol/phthiodiolone dimycocerosyl transferase family protein [Micromonospora haikouensis]|uniref:phthiocerol/phthiodiolone dimycocerosyl transferase family protein n=1 Tax=Micromonospora haikouensis TaxID=686309 RepID=UPI003D91A553
MSAAREAHRALSPLERWYWIADQVSPLNVIARVRVHGHVPPELLRAALDELQARHPLLRVAIATRPDGRRPRFVPTDRPIPLRVGPDPDGAGDGRLPAAPGVPTESAHAASVDPDAGWLREVNERELADRVDWRAGPLCRAVVLTTGAAPGDAHDLILTLPHCVADGTTALSLLRQWIEYADRLAAQGPPGPDGRPFGGAVPDREPALPPAERMFPRRYRGVTGALRLGGQLLRDLYAVRRHRPARVTPSRFVPFTERRSRLLHRTLTAEQVAALARACRRERTTVHGALAAAMVLAVAAETPPPAPGHVAIGSPVDFRAALTPPVPERAVGAYVATVPSFVPYRPGVSLWQVARSISGDLAGRRQRGSHFAMVDLVRLSCPPSVAASDRFVELTERTGPVNLCLSNLGRYDFPDRIGAWRLGGAQFVAGLSVCGYFVATANTSHGELAWNFVHVPEAVPDARAARLVAACVDAVLAEIDDSAAGAGEAAAETGETAAGTEETAAGTDVEAAGVAAVAGGTDGGAGT